MPSGAVVVADLSGTEANVLLLDPINFGRYRRRESCRYHGGRFRSTPARIRVPSTGHWYAVVDRGGASGRVEASIRVVAA